MRTGEDRLAYLDGWRGMAVAFLLVGHFFPVPGINFGAFGVELFFVLSGRLMADVLILREATVGTFLFRRASRIMPALLIYLSAVWVLTLLVPGWGEVRAGDYFAGLFFVANYWEVFDSMAGVFTHLWSLAVEEHAYIFLVLIGVVSLRRRYLAGVFAVVVAAVCIGWGIFSAVEMHLGGRDLYWRSDVRAASVLLPFGLLLLRPLLPPVAVGYAPVFGVAVGAILMSYAFPEWVRYSLGTICLALSVVALDMSSNRLQAALSWRPLTALGIVSFSIYLWQQLFYANQWRFGAVLAVSIAVLAGIASFMLVEQPARKRLNRWWATHQRTSHASDAAATPFKSS